MPDRQRHCRAAAAASTTGSSQVDRAARHGVHRARPARAFTWAASARATRWIARPPCCASAASRDFLIQSGGDLYVAGRNGDVPWKLGIADPRGAAGQTFATLELERRHVQHLWRLRALLHQGRRPLPPPDRSRQRHAGHRHAAASPSSPTRADAAPTCCRPACSSSGPAEGMALIEQLPAGRRRDRDGGQPGADLERPQGPAGHRRAADRRAVAGRMRRGPRAGWHRYTSRHMNGAPLTLDLVQTVAFAGIILFLGYGLRKLIPPLARVNIPAPVCGGLPVAGVLAVLYSYGYQPLAFTTTLQVPLQNTFFASIGFAASLALLRRGGPLVLRLLPDRAGRRRPAERGRRRRGLDARAASADGRAGRIGDADRRTGDRAWRSRRCSSRPACLAPPPWPSPPRWSASSPAA